MIAIGVLFVFCAGLVAAAEPGYECFSFLSSNSKFYDIRDLEKNGRDAKEYDMDATISVDKTTISGTLHWNLCKIVPPPPQCSKTAQSTGFFISKDLSKCYVLSNNGDGGSTTWSYSFYDGEDSYDKTSLDGYVIKGDNSAASTVAYIAPFNVNFKIVCDASATTPSNITYIQDKNGDLTIYMLSEEGCGVYSLGPLANLQKYKLIICIVGMIGGLILVFLGARIFKVGLAFLVFLMRYYLV